MNLTVGLMYFDISCLRKMAKDFYRPGSNVEMRPFRVSNGPEMADMLLTHFQFIVLKYQGRGRLHFHSHGWSGSVTIISELGPQEYDLYSQEPAERWIDFGTGNGTLAELVICLGSRHNAASQGLEVWLRGVEFFDPQPWLPAAIPVSNHADLAYGQFGDFLVPHLDQVIGRTLKNTGVWATDDIEFFAKHIKAGDTVFDIGANIGHHTVCFSKMVGEGRVYAFEPQLNIFRFACANLAVNGCHNTTLLQGCLGAEPGQVRMEAVSYDEEANYGALGVSVDGARGEIVPVWTLDGLIADGKVIVDRIDFMKIDVQSFEIFVLQGAIECLRKFKPDIFIEISPFWMSRWGYSYLDVYQLLSDLGYQFHHSAQGAGIVDGVRQWSGDNGEEWDVFCTVRR